MPQTSNSRIVKWLSCSWRDKLYYIDKIRIAVITEHMLFGNAVHETIENRVNNSISKEQSPEYFRSRFSEMLKVDMTEEYRNTIFQNPDIVTPQQELDFKNNKRINRRGLSLKSFIREKKNLLKDMYVKGPLLVDLAIEELDVKFPGWKLISAEGSLNADLGDGWRFVGFKDILIQHEDRIILIDWKSCSWGWDAKKKTNKTITNQLVYYKKFTADLYNFDVEKIDTYFALLKRTAFKQDKQTKKFVPNKNAIEIFKVSTGKKKIQNALNILNNHVYNVSKGNFVKNRMSCEDCEYKWTEYCTGPKMEANTNGKKENQNSNPERSPA